VHERIERGEGSRLALGELTADLFEEGFGRRPSTVTAWESRGRSSRTSTDFVYQYDGNAGAHALARPILDGEAGRLSLRRVPLVGSSRYAIDALHDAGVDLSAGSSRGGVRHAVVARRRLEESRRTFATRRLLAGPGQGAEAG
jgi:hypothetical protein